MVGRPDLASVADSVVFGYGEPDAGDVTAYWNAVRSAKSARTKTRPRRRRWGRLFSVRGLLFRDKRPVEQLREVTKAPGRGLGVPVLRRATA